MREGGDRILAPPRGTNTHPFPPKKIEKQISRRIKKRKGKIFGFFIGFILNPCGKHPIASYFEKKGKLPQRTRFVLIQLGRVRRRFN